eukprot:g4422.t1
MSSRDRQRAVRGVLAARDRQRRKLQAAASKLLGEFPSSSACGHGAPAKASVLSVSLAPREHAATTGARQYVAEIVAAQDAAVRRQRDAKLEQWRRAVYEEERETERAWARVQEQQRQWRELTDRDGSVAAPEAAWDLARARRAAAGDAQMGFWRGCAHRADPPARRDELGRARRPRKVLQQDWEAQRSIDARWHFGGARGGGGGGGAPGDGPYGPYAGGGPAAAPSGGARGAARARRAAAARAPPPPPLPPAARAAAEACQARLQAREKQHRMEMWAEVDFAARPSPWGGFYDAGGAGGGRK